MAYFCLADLCSSTFYISILALGFFRQLLMCDEKTFIFPTVLIFYMWCPFCFKAFGGGESSVYWGRAETSFTAHTEISEGERWFWTLKCLKFPCWMPLGTMLNFATSLLCFCLPSTQMSQGSWGITRNSHFVPKGVQGHKNQAWSLFI